MKVYDGDKMILGRLASAVAKDALLGEEVKVINCEKVMISGSKYMNFSKYTQKYSRKGHPSLSANLTRLPDRVVRRAIRGMLPWKNTRGREAFKRIMCFVGTPDELKNEKTITLEGASIDKLPTLKYVKIGEICKYLGGRDKDY